MLRKGESVENLGKMAELFEDHSPLQLAARGTLDGGAFVVVGRLQYRHPQGTWNEWWLRFDDDRALWLSEDNGQYVITRAVGEQTVPRFDELTPGRSLRLAGVDYSVANRTRAKVVAGQGELPFVVGSGYDADVVDLRDPTGSFATLDFSDHAVAAGEGPAQALLYVGRAVTLDALKLDGLRETLERVVATEPFSCPNCGSPVQASLATTKSITCPSCASVIDLAAGSGGRFAFVRQAARFRPTIPIGRTGRLDDVQWTVVGFQRRRGEVDEDTFDGTSTCCTSRRRASRFLVDDNGHWTSPGSCSARRPTAAAWSRPVASLDGPSFITSPITAPRSAMSRASSIGRSEKATRPSTRNSSRRRAACRARPNRRGDLERARYLAGRRSRQGLRTCRALPMPTGLGMLQPSVATDWRSRYR